ncbi:MAG: hypothetical protein KDD47_28695 [Acidobacteria bacterium]|nr:hypothetical protein [Acidobacteriota bacterium]
MTDKSPKPKKKPLATQTGSGMEWVKRATNLAVFLDSGDVYISQGDPTMGDDVEMVWFPPEQIPTLIQWLQEVSDYVEEEGIGPH